MTHDIHAHRILILDFGSQYTQLIARRVREIGVYCEMRPFDMSEDEIRAFNPSGIILSGGPESVHEADSPRARKRCSNWACRCSASATACRPWPSSSAARSKVPNCASSVMPKFTWSATSRLLHDIRDHIDATALFGSMCG